MEHGLGDIEGHRRRQGALRPADLFSGVRRAYAARWPPSAARLRRILELRPGERILEVGPGVGIYSLPIAAAIPSSGRLDALDVQRDVLGVLARRAGRAGVPIVPVVGDAQRLPYPDGSFDAACL